MMYQILKVVKSEALAYAGPGYTTIDHGSLPQENGLAMFLGPGMPMDIYFDKGGEYDLFVALNGKHQSLDVLVSALSAIHLGLTKQKVYPNGEGWQILNVETATLPNYLDREVSETRQWLYGSLLRVKVYFEGVCET